MQKSLKQAKRYRVVPLFGLLYVSLYFLMGAQIMITNVTIVFYTFIFGVFTGKPHSKPLELLEHNVINIPIITISHETSRDFN